MAKRGSGRSTTQWPIALRGIVAAAILLVIGIIILPKDHQSAQWALVTVVVTAAVLVTLHVAPIARPRSSSAAARLSFGNFVTLAIGLLAGLGAWVAYFVYINGLLEKIVHNPAPLQILESRRQTWLTVTGGQIVVFWGILFFLLLIERSPKYKEWRVWFFGLAVMVLILHVTNVLTIIPDLDAVLRAVPASTTLPQATP